MNKNELQAEMKRKGMTYGNMADLLGISLNGFWRKINGMNDFTLTEIRTMVKELELDEEKLKVIFFK